MVVQVRPAPALLDGAIDRCDVCSHDRAYLRSRERPAYEQGSPKLRIADLFAGCGGLTLGAAQAARRAGMGLDVRLAVDMDPSALEVYGKNFPKAVTSRLPVEMLFDGQIGSAPTSIEHEVARWVGTLDILLGGPPCQGHSDLNNRSRRNDPRNALYVRMARAAEVLRPRIVIIENVPTVANDVEKATQLTAAALRCAGYEVEEGVIRLDRLGVPQTRKRHVLVAVFETKGLVLDGLPAPCAAHTTRSVEWAIGDFASNASDDMFNTASTPSEENRKRIDWLFDNDKYDLPNSRRPKCHQGDHSYVSMYGRLRADRPAQTITTGFGSMGQGRYVHPKERRTITPHEAARLQMLPDFFDFPTASRGAMARLIGNAVPPILTEVLASKLIEDGVLAHAMEKEAGF